MVSMLGFAPPLAANPQGPVADSAAKKDSAKKSKREKREEVNARLKKKRKIERYKKRKDSKIKAGGARLFMEADVSTLEKILLDFRRYTELGKEFDQVKVLRRNKKKGTTDVYLRFPILHGASHLWVILRFQPKKCPSEDVCMIEARLVKGNVRRFDLTYRIHKLDSGESRLDIEMLVDPKLPFASSIISDETARQAAKAGRRIRHRAELVDKRKRAAEKNKGKKAGDQS